MTPAHQTLKRIRIVLADDDAMFRGMCRDLISCEPDMEIIAEMYDPDQVPVFVATRKPDILLLSLAIGRQRGFEVLEHIYSLRLPTRVIAVCRPESQADGVRAVRTGSHGLLPQNTAPELILKCIRKVYDGELWLDRVTTAEVLAQLTHEAQPPRFDRDPKTNPLSPREREIVALVTQGLKNRELADRLVISEQTVKNHMHNIFDKLGVSDRLELALYAVHHGLQNGPTPSRQK